jgi:hypothetical protein
MQRKLPSGTIKSLPNLEKPHAAQPVVGPKKLTRGAGSSQQGRRYSARNR